MVRYNPSEDDLLIERVYGREVVHQITDVGSTELTYKRPDGAEVTKYISDIRQGLEEGRFAVKPANAQEANR